MVTFSSLKEYLNIIHDLNEAEVWVEDFVFLISFEQVVGMRNIIQR